MNSIDLTPYKIQLIKNGSEVYKINQGSTSPLHARKNQKELAADNRSRKIVYKPENGEQFSVLVNERSFQLLSSLRDGQWHSIESLKTTKSETRKPVSDLRQVGMQIGTMLKPSQYKLFGEVELYPMGLGFEIKQVTDLLPSISECNLIERAKAKAGIAKRMAKINKSVEFLEREG
ncbi:hypothetical protein [Methylomonas sp. AM2-LC]|uniref:hypothetical protein n=1 Tax=Methylomonas sp. AM2-LC TaxID=3153301 RepID=UPI003265B0CB